jgi:hypothetical protein
LLVLAINQVLASEALVLWYKTNKKGIEKEVAQLVKDMKVEAFIL